MIAALSLAALILVLVAHFTGIALLGHRILPHYALAKVVSPALACLVLFYVEHFVGLGSLAWIQLFTMPLFLFLIWRERAVLRANWAVEAVFVAAFGYTLLSGLCSPDIGGNSEELTDLTFIANYSSGVKLPPPDRWFPPYRFDVYYGFQYYSAALLGRVLHLDLGTTYRLSLCVIVALIGVAAGAAAYLFGAKRKSSLVSVAALLFGGTGASFVAPFMIRPSHLHDGMRFIGEAAIPQKVTTAFGRWILHVSHVPGLKPMWLPAETLGYLVPLGDLHPPMGGFLLLMLALLCIALIETHSERRAAPAVLAATVPVVAATNAWNLPLQGLLVGGWIGWRLLRRIPVPWGSLFAGAGAALLFAYPFLKSFSLHSFDYGVRLRLVPRAEHTPPVLGLIVFAPYLLLAAAAAWPARDNSGARWWCFFWIALLALTELFYADDVYGDHINRFNSTLKWWPWIMAGILITLGPLVLEGKERFTRWAGAAALLLVMSFAGPIVSSLLAAPKDHWGRIDGARWIDSEAAQKAILEFLKQQPPCTVLQRLEADAFTEAPGLVIHAGQTAFLGWPGHERLWRGDRSDIRIRSDEVKRFYRGEMSGSASWLLENNIAHVLWLKTEAILQPGTFDKIDAQIRRAYFWRQFSAEGSVRAGVWSRRQDPLAEGLSP